MPFLFVALSLLAVGAMMATAARTTPKQLPSGPPPTKMQPGEVWAVAGSIDRDMTEDSWAAFHDNLSSIMGQMGARIGKLVSSGRTFAIQVQPTTEVVTIQVPMVDPPFTITKATKLQGVTAISGVPRTGVPRTCVPGTCVPGTCVPGTWRYA